MPAYSQVFPWPSPSGNFEFFEKQIKRHTKVCSLSNDADGVYTIRRKNGCPIKVLICDCYAFGAAEYREAKEEITGLNAIIINSTWCNYSWEAKCQCREDQVGIFRIGDFMAALHRKDFWNHLNEEESKRFSEINSAC
jgi:hypothetical protein